MKKPLQNFGSISSTNIIFFSNILFVIWQLTLQDFVIVWQNTLCTVFHPVMVLLNSVARWCNTTQFFTKMVSFYMLVCMGVGRNFSMRGH